MRLKRIQAEATLDDKGRLALPAKFRQGLKEAKADDVKGLVLIFLGGGIHGFLPEDYEAMLEAERPRGLGRFDPRAMDFRAIFETGAVEVEFDANGRFRLPAGLAQLAGISHDVLVMSSVEWIEFWDPQRWAARLGQASAGLGSPPVH